jgi:hypothetical protein
MKNNYFLFFITLFSVSASYSQDIPIEYLAMELQQNNQGYSKTILENEIGGIKVEHIVLSSDKVDKIQLDDTSRFIYLFIKGQGNLISNNKSHEIVPETILLSNSVSGISIHVAKNDTLHYLKISSKLTEQDLMDLKEFPIENTQKIYLKKFIDCEAYTEPIKSPNTISRTVLPNKYIPRIAMGTVQTIGPDKVAPHEHGMLEQLFLGLTDNNVIVSADEAKIDFPAYSVLHIPLGSSHSVEAKKGDIMYYMWMDFFLDKKGEEWLKTHKSIKKTNK